MTVWQANDSKFVMSQPNRLQENWQKMKPLLQEKWDRLSDTDLDYIAGQFDILVETLRQLYGGRIEIIQEAAIRDSVNDILNKL